MIENFRNRYIQWNPQDGAIQLQFLDSIDFLPYMDDCTRIGQIMADVEDKYDYGPFKHKIPKELDGCAFNCMSQEEFADYLVDRYKGQYDIEYKERYESWIEIHKKG